jgi:uncharacterized protein YjdB
MRHLALCSLVLAACKGGDSDSTDTNVDLGDLVGILLTPEQPVMPVGGDTQLTATGLLSDRTTTDLTAVVEWQSSDSGVATVSDGLDQEGLLTAAGTGEAVITATAEGITSSEVKVTVTDAELLGISVEPKEVTVAAGDTLSLTCQAAWSDGSRGDASGQVRWVTGNGEVATMDPGGLLTGVAVGRTEVHAEWEATASNVAAVEVIEASDDRADLEVQEVTIEAGGGYAVVTVRIVNNGGNSANAFWVDVFVDAPSTPSVGDYGDDFTEVDYVGPQGGYAVLTFTVPMGDGAHEVAVLLDSAGTVDEEDEANNVWSDIFETSSTVPGPNLTITYFDWLADETSIYYAIDVLNGGSEDAPEFFIDLFLDQGSEPAIETDGDEYVTVAGLGAGETTSADFLVDRTCSSCTSWILIDSYDHVEETDENDNVAGPIEVGDDGGWDTGY